MAYYRLIFRHSDAHDLQIYRDVIFILSLCCGKTKSGGDYMPRKHKKLGKKLRPIVPKTTWRDGAYLDTLKQLQEEREEDSQSF